MSLTPAQLQHKREHKATLGGRKPRYSTTPKNPQDKIEIKVLPPTALPKKSGGLRKFGNFVSSIFARRKI